MKQIIKKINVLALSGMLLAGGLAHAANSNRQTPNVRNTATGANDEPQWEAIQNPQNPGNCDQADSRACLGFESSSGDIQVLQFGNYTP